MVYNLLYKSEYFTVYDMKQIDYNVWYKVNSLQSII